MTNTELCYTPATDLSRMIRSKTLSPVELTRAVLDRLERLNPLLNCFCTVTADEAMASARSAEGAV
ncbi:MAG: amidase, partial [Candidatus Rokuibacteriota bacterium]